MSILYYSVNRPITPGSIPNNSRIINVVNYNEKKYIDAIGREAWGYVEASYPLSDYEDYELVKAMPRFHRKLERGDIVRTQGIEAVVDKIAFQDVFNDDDISRSYIDTEFTDIGGVYRSWKSYSDGGRVEYFDEGNMIDLVRPEINEVVHMCVGTLHESGIEASDRFTYFKIEGRKAYLYSGCENFGFVDLDRYSDDEECFANLINGCLDMLDEDVKFISFPCRLVGGRMLILNHGPRGVLKIMVRDEIIRVVETMKVRGFEGNDVKMKVAKAYVRSKGDVEEAAKRLNSDDGTNSWIAVSQRDKKGNKYYGVNNLDKGWKVLFV